MKPSLPLVALRACALFCSPLPMSTAVGAPTLIFFEPSPLDPPTAVQTAIGACVNSVKARDPQRCEPAVR